MNKFEKILIILCFSVVVLSALTVISIKAYELEDIGSWRYILPDYNASVVGELTGSLTDLNSSDLLTVTGSEVLGTPAFDYRFNFTLEQSILNVNILTSVEYTGNLAHDVELQLYDHDLENWITLTHYPDSVELIWYNVSLSTLELSQIMNESNQTWIRIFHGDAGNMNHDIMIDYFKIRYFEPDFSLLDNPLNKYGYGIAIVLLILGIIIGVSVKKHE